MLAAAQVRNALADALTGLPLTGAAVHPGRSVPLAEAELPAWVINIEADDTEFEGVHYPADELHTLALLAELKARDVDDLEAVFDQGELQARQALGGPSPAPYQLRIVGAVRLPQRDGEAAAGTLRLRVEASYVTAQDDPETIHSD